MKKTKSNTNTKKYDIDLEKMKLNGITFGKMKDNFKPIDDVIDFFNICNYDDNNDDINIINLGGEKCEQLRHFLSLKEKYEEIICKSIECYKYNKKNENFINYISEKKSEIIGKKGNKKFYFDLKCFILAKTLSMILNGKNANVIVNILYCYNILTVMSQHFINFFKYIDMNEISSNSSFDFSIHVSITVDNVTHDILIIWYFKQARMKMVNIDEETKCKCIHLKFDDVNHFEPTDRIIEHCFNTFCNRVAYCIKWEKCAYCVIKKKKNKKGNYNSDKKIKKDYSSQTKKYQEGEKQSEHRQNTQDRTDNKQNVQNQTGNEQKNYDMEIATKNLMIMLFGHCDDNNDTNNIDNIDDVGTECDDTDYSDVDCDYEFSSDCDSNYDHDECDFEYYQKCHLANQPEHAVDFDWRKYYGEHPCHNEVRLRNHTTEDMLFLQSVSDIIDIFANTCCKKCKNCEKDIIVSMFSELCIECFPKNMKIFFSEENCIDIVSLVEKYNIEYYVDNFVEVLSEIYDDNFLCQTDDPIKKVHHDINKKIQNNIISSVILQVREKYKLARVKYNELHYIEMYSKVKMDWNRYFLCFLIAHNFSKVFNIVAFESEKKYKNFRFDFWGIVIVDNEQKEFCIEIDDKSHNSNKAKKKDICKNEYCNDENILLFRIDTRGLPNDCDKIYSFFLEKYNIFVNDFSRNFFG